MSFNSIYDIAGSAMRAQALRLNTIASNLANADSVASTPEQAFRSLKPVFSSVYQGSQGPLSGIGVDVTGLTRSDRAIERRYEPGNPLADEEGFVYYGNVNVVEEMADMLSASRAFQTSVDVVSRVNSMQQSLLRLGQE